MAKKSMILKQQAPAKFSTRKYNRCKLCGRPHAYLRDYGVCRICFRTLAYKARSPVSARLPGNLSAILRCSLDVHKVRRRLAASSGEKNWICLIRCWHDLPYTKYSSDVSPRMMKESIPLYTAGGRAA